MSTHASEPDADAPPPSSILHIIPGPYSAPMSARAANRFARGDHHVFPSVSALDRRATSPLAVMALVFAVLVAAGGIGSALAFRFGKANVTTGKASVAPVVPLTASPSEPR